MRGRSLPFLFLFTVLASCQGVSSEDAGWLVKRYTRVVSDAYRRSDVKLIDSIVGPNTPEGRKLTGLIGVRLDMGITLDAEMLDLEVTGVEQEENELRVRTRERWRYRDLRIGTGEQVGEESLDDYELLYIFKKVKKAWLVEETRFTAPPRVGRKTTPWGADAGVMHSFIPPAADQKGERP